MAQQSNVLECSTSNRASSRSDTATDAVAVRRLITNDADEQAANLGRWDQTYEQLTAGRFEGRLTEVWLDQLQVFRETTTQSVYQAGHAWHGSHTFGIPVAMSGPATFHGRAMEPNSLLTLRADGELDFRTPLRLDIIGICVPTDELLQCALHYEELDIESLLQNADLVHCSSADLWSIRRCLSESFSTLEAHAGALSRHPSARKAARDAILAQLCEVLCASRANGPRPMSLVLRQHLVDRAKALALQDPCIPVTVADLCRRLRVSRRTLQYSFQDTIGISPSTYLRAVRLNGARRELKSHGGAFASVQDAAAHWGFWHLGHFSADYKRMFGELPSDTLRKRTAA
jgi:AraC family ethanolamine operon transcriptional activator